jgi:hypothetical protein
MIHTPMQMLKKARCLAKMILRLKEQGEHNCHEIDQMAQEAQYIEFDTREFEDDKEKETNT